MHNYFVLLIACLTLTFQRSFVGTASISRVKAIEDRSSEKDTSVQELQNLKRSVGKRGRTMYVIKPVYPSSTNINGEITRLEMNGEGKENEELIPKVVENMDIKYNDIAPSEELKKNAISFLSSLEVDKSINKHLTPPVAEISSVPTYFAGKVGSFSVQYSPLDMAEYIFWTGDEKGVTLAIEEFLQEDLMTRDEAIAFLQEIKFTLEHLKKRYSQLGLGSHLTSHELDVKGTIHKLSNWYIKPELQNKIVNTYQTKEETSKKRFTNTMQPFPTQVIADEISEKQSGDYGEVLEKLRMADFLHTEYSLEEIIYQLAKVMFTQSLTWGNTQAHQALQKFTNFLEIEAERGHISRELEKKVLDVLIASLSDTLSEHPELLSAARDGEDPIATNEDAQHFIKQILKFKPGNTEVFADSDENGSNRFQRKQNKITESVQFDLENIKKLQTNVD